MATGSLNWRPLGGFWLWFQPLCVSPKSHPFVSNDSWPVISLVLDRGNTVVFIIGDSGIRVSKNRIMGGKDPGWGKIENKLQGRV